MPDKILVQPSELSLNDIPPELRGTFHSPKGKKLSEDEDIGQISTKERTGMKLKRNENDFKASDLLFNDFE